VLATARDLADFIPWRPAAPPVTTESCIQGPALAPTNASLPSPSRVNLTSAPIPSIALLLAIPTGTARNTPSARLQPKPAKLTSRMVPLAPPTASASPTSASTAFVATKPVRNCALLARPNEKATDRTVTAVLSELGQTPMATAKTKERLTAHLSTDSVTDKARVRPTPPNSAQPRVASQMMSVSADFAWMASAATASVTAPAKPVPSR